MSSNYQLLGAIPTVVRQESAPVKSFHHSNDEPPPLPRRRVVDKTESLLPEAASAPPMLPPRSHGNLCMSRPRSIVGSTGLNYIHMQFNKNTEGAALPPRGRTQTTYSELVREVSGDPVQADKVLGRSSSEDDLTANTQNLRVSTHEQHLDNVDLLRMNVMKNGGSHSNPDVTRDSISPQPVDKEGSPPPPLPVRNKPIATSGSHEHISGSREHISRSHEHISGSREHISGSHEHIGASHELNPFDQGDPFESGKDVSDPSDFYQVPRSNTQMVANGDNNISEEQPVVSQSPASCDQLSTLPSGYEKSTLWVSADDDEYQAPDIPYHDHYDVPTKHNPNDQHDDDATRLNPNDQHHDDDDEGDEYINPDLIGGDHDNGDDITPITTDEVQEILGNNDVTASTTLQSSSVDEYSYPIELLGLSTTSPTEPSRTTEIPLPPKAIETVPLPRATELPPRASETSTALPLPPRVSRGIETVPPSRATNTISKEQQSRPLPPLPYTSQPSHVARQEPPLPARTTCMVKSNSLGRTMSALPRQQPRYDRESWIMKYVQQGYSRDQVVRALAITQNDFHMASNILKEFVKMR